MNLKQNIVCVLLALSAAASWAQTNELAWTMERAVKQLDRQGSDLETVLSEVTIDMSGGDSEAEQISGRFYMNDKGEFRVSAVAPTERVMLFDGSTVYQYDPAANLVKEYRLSKHKDRLEAFIPLGFSTTGKDFNRDFLVTFIGEETIGDRRTLGLELTPKKDSTRAIVSRIQLWVDQSSWLPARQIITHSSNGAVLTVNYSGTARNLDLNPDLFKDKWPKGTQKQRM